MALGENPDQKEWNLSCLLIIIIQHRRLTSPCLASDHNPPIYFLSLSLWGDHPWSEEFLESWSLPWQFLNSIFESRMLLKPVWMRKYKSCFFSQSEYENCRHVGKPEVLHWIVKKKKSRIAHACHSCRRKVRLRIIFFALVSETIVSFLFV